MMVWEREMRTKWRVEWPNYLYIWFCLEPGIIFCLLVPMEWRWVWALWMVLCISVKWAEIMNVHMWMHVRVLLKARTCVQACMRDCPLRYFGPRSFPRPLPFSLSLIPFALNTWIPSFQKHAFLCFLYSFPPTLFPLASWPNLLTGEHTAISTENYTPLGLLLPSRVDTPSVELPVHHEGYLSKCGHVWHILNALLCKAYIAQIPWKK